jgi:hypothetical protein
MVDMIEAALDVTFDGPRERQPLGSLPTVRNAPAQSHLQICQSAVHAFAGPEAIGDGVEPRLEDRLQDVLHRCLDDPVFHGRNAQGSETPWFARLGDEHSSHRARLEQTVPKVLADCYEERLNSLLDHSPYRDPVYTRTAGTAIALHASEGHPKITEIGNEPP